VLGMALKRGRKHDRSTTSCVTSNKLPRGPTRKWETMRVLRRINGIEVEEET
jgi:hypothetical protein